MGSWHSEFRLPSIDSSPLGHALLSILKANIGGDLSLQLGESRPLNRASDNGLPCRFDSPDSDAGTCSVSSPCLTNLIYF